MYNYLIKESQNYFLNDVLLVVAYFSLLHFFFFFNHDRICLVNHIVLSFVVNLLVSWILIQEMIPPVLGKDGSFCPLSKYFHGFL